MNGLHEEPSEDEFLLDSTPGLIEDEFDWYEFHQLKQYLHESDLLEIITPSTASWVDGDPTRLRTKFGINVSRRQNWDLGKEEARHVKTRVNSIFGLNCQDTVTLDMLLDKYLGLDSDLCGILKNELELDDKQYLQFMITYCVQCAYKVSSKSLHDSFSLLKPFVVMPEEEYNCIWEKIAYKEEKSGNEISSGRRDFCLWEKLESKVNHILRQVSIVNRPGKISIALDDDKVWYNMTRSSLGDSFGIKITRHVKDNRIGIVLHTAVSSALNIPLGCTFERVKEKTELCYKRIFSFMFGTNGGIDLLNVNAHSDRGYSLPSIVFDFLIQNGANIVCTTKRFQTCWPFNFGVNRQSQNDSRTFIDSSGAPCLYIKNTTVGRMKRVQAVAFRNGSGAVSTAVSSIHSGYEWEGITEIDGCRLARMYEDDGACLQKLFFQRVEGLVDNTEDQVDRDMCETFLSEMIDPLTMLQGSADWHQLRKFSLTSSQTFESFKLAFPLFKDDNSWVHMAKYAFGSRMTNTLLGSSQLSEEERGLATSTRTRTELTEEENIVLPLSDYLGLLLDANENSSSDNEEYVNLLLSYVSENQTLSDANAESLLSGMTSRFKSKLKSILMERIPKEYQGQCTDAGLKRWFTYSNAEREYIFFKSSVLKDKLKERGIRPGGNTVIHLIEALAGTAVSNDNATDALSSSDTEPKQLAMKALLKHSFQKPQKGTIREHCSLGHKLEQPILKSWIQQTKDFYFPVLGLQVSSAYKVGLAGKKGQPAVKDSVDFHLHVEESDSAVEGRVAWGFEAKGRVTVASSHAESDVLEDLVRDDHIRIVDMDVNTNLRIPHERWQVLHHAYTYDYPTVVHAVGNSQGELIQSTMIDFTETTKQHYEKVLLDLKELLLEWVYTPNRSPVKIPEEVMTVAKQIDHINGDVALQGAVNLWKEMSILPLPLPPLQRIIPSVHANWNQKKSGSDTTTMLMDRCLCPLPHTNPSSVAVNRLLSMTFVFIHRIYQLYTAQSELNYPSLGHYRNAASHRSTFQKTLLHCHKIFMTKLNQMNNPQEQNSQAVSNPRVRPLRHKINSVNVERIEKNAFDIPEVSQKTPAKLSRKIIEGTAPDNFCHLDRICKGKPFKVFSKEKKPLQMRCDYPGCSGKTSWYCVGCKQWYCIEKKVKDDMSDVNNFGVGLIKVKGKEKQFQVLCYHRKHLQTP